MTLCLKKPAVFVGEPWELTTCLHLVIFQEGVLRIIHLFFDVDGMVFPYQTKDAWNFRSVQKGVFFFHTKPVNLLGVKLV